MSLAERFKSVRTNAGLTQVQVADAIGVNQSVISDLERGVTVDPGSEMLLRAAELFHTDPRHLLFGSDSIPQAIATTPVGLETEESEDQQAMLRLYLRLNAGHKRALLAIARALRDSERSEHQNQTS